MRASVTISAGFALLGAAAAASNSAAAAAANSAACPGNVLNETVEAFAASNQPNVNVAELVKFVDERAAMCPNEAHVQKYAAMARFNLANRTNGQEKLDHAMAARKFVAAMNAGMNGTDGLRMFMVGGQMGQSRLDDAYEVDKRSLEMLFVAETGAGALIPEHQPLQPGVNPGPCSDWAGSWATTTSIFIRERGDNAAAFNFLDRLIAACEANIVQGRNRDTLSHRARALFASVDRAPMAAGVKEKLDRITADTERYKLLRGGYDTLYWSEFDDKRLFDLYVKARLKEAPKLPMEQWFTPENIDKETTIAQIGAAFDETWAADAAAGGIRQAHKIYRDFMSRALALANQSARPPMAKRILTLGAFRHAEGEYRKPENAALPKPPIFLYNWIDPMTLREAEAARGAPGGR
jgi:hypothetical protein